MRTEELMEHRRLLGGLIERMLELEGPVGCQGLLRAARRLLRSPRRPRPSLGLHSDGAEVRNGSQRFLVAKTVRQNFREA